MLVPVVIALLISVFFVTLFLLALRSPTPHDLRVGVTGPSAATAEVQQAVYTAAPGALDLSVYPNPGAAQAAVEHRDVYAAVVIEGDQWTMLVAGANGAALIPALQRLFQSAVLSWPRWTWLHHWSAGASGAHLLGESLPSSLPGDS